MSRLSPFRRLLKTFHVEGIPWPGSVFYNAISGVDIFQRHYELIAADILRHCPAGSILDIGTGPGWLLVKLHDQAPDGSLTGLDISPAMVAKARQNLAKAGLAGRIEVRLGAAQSLPFADSSFDAVVSTGSIHHWNDPAAGLNEVHRVLKPGGHALIYDIVSDTPKDVLRESAHAFGRLKIWLCWLHSYEEPFYSLENLRGLAPLSRFGEGEIRFVGVMGCLTLKK
jgi:ubiquinone/menaquinone biosynthesis C-methylase UbiE